MPRILHDRITEAVATAVGRLWGIDPPDVLLNQTPGPAFGELATPLCLGLARVLKRPPRALAEELTAALDIEGVRRLEVAGPGYINFHLDRAFVFNASSRELTSGKYAGFTAGPEKVIVEHTNINPNKAAHIGHLRNAAIGDTFVRILRFTGRRVEVQNYIDNTGVQVADVIVGFRFIENRSLEEVRKIIRDPDTRFDYYCWDLYARASAWYEANDPGFSRRAETLAAIEQGTGEIAAMAEDVATAIVHAHLRTMERIGVRYDLLPRESDILHLKFWEQAFARLKECKAIFFETEGKNAGCWVMRVDTDAGAEDKIIVRSNGTVTYVGKDIAYQLWKLGLLDRDFHYRVFHRYGDGAEVWTTSSEGGEARHPDFGRGATVYNVIDVRQSYLQTVVREGVRALGSADAAEKSIHFSYEMVALTPRCAAQLGIELSDEDRRRPYVEVSGRKGQGVKADDLLDALEEKALGEVRQRNAEFPEDEQRRIAHQIAVGALRYFLLRFTRNAVIAFDFDEALSFDGETGPYIQYAAVRANNILRQVAARYPDFSPAQIREIQNSGRLAEWLEQSDEIWELVWAAARLDETAAQVASTLEPATLAKFTFNVAQKFSLFYHKFRVIGEEDAERRLFYLAIVDFVRRSLTEALQLMGITVPERM